MRKGTGSSSHGPWVGAWLSAGVPRTEDQVVAEEFPVDTGRLRNGGRMLSTKRASQPPGMKKAEREVELA